MRAALIQLSSTLDIDRNLATCRRLAEAAAEARADWILFPENAPFLGADEEKLPIAETIDGPQVQAFSDMARDLNAFVTLGSFAEKSPDPGRTLNTQVHFRPDGSIAAIYRKIHLFDVTVDGDLSFRESDSVYPGEEIVTTTVDDRSGAPHTVGLTICYDLRFPELYRELRARDAEALTVPSAFTLNTGRAHWHALLKARAIENQCYVLAPNQTGHHYGRRYSYGQSAIYDPWGQSVAIAPDRECFVLADLDFDYVAEIRADLPVFAHRRVQDLL